METEHEWQIIKGHIQNRKNRFNNYWHIGLRVNASGNWAWVSGKQLTINRWQSWQPRDGAHFAVRASNSPPGTIGHFNYVRGNFSAGYICENPTDCSRDGIICKVQAKIIEIQTTKILRNSAESSKSPTRKTATTRFSRIEKQRKPDVMVMVEKVQPPSGYIHWTVSVIPLSCVILVLVCVIVFLLWRLKQRPKKQLGDINVEAIHYDVNTKSILNTKGKEKKQPGSNHVRVHFREPNQKPADCPIPRRVAIKRKSSKELEGKYPLNKSGDGEEDEVDCADLSANGSVQLAALRQNRPADSPIVRRSAIRRKNSKELGGKYPLNKSGDGGEDKVERADSCENTPKDGNDVVHNSSQCCRQVVQNGDGSIKKPAATDCSNVELAYVKIIFPED